ncbi:MAG: MBL fold metallo-hydrolase [Planctomycetota bacterium]|nr:MBL fold metallo-hydrolase [Planctomycetota bacterium]
MSPSDTGKCPRPSCMEVVFLDVGHGCCTVIVTPHQRRVVLVDCNAGAGPGTIRYLERSQLPLPDVICISHLHDDHVAGFAAIFRHLIEKRVGVERVYTNYAGHTSRKRSRDGGQAVVQQLRDLLDGEGNRLRDFHSSEDPYELDGLILTVLHPDKFDLRNHQDRDEMHNELSGVLRVTYGKSSVLLPGDIEGWAASCLLSRHTPLQLRAQLLLFPHHGAGWEHNSPAGATTTRHGIDVVSPSVFVSAVAPTWTVLSVGSNNDGSWSSYEHPCQDVLDLLRSWHREQGSGFVCTEATPRCDTTICERARSELPAGAIRVPCGGSIRFSLDTDGSVNMDPTAQSEWERVVERLPQPQCRG